MTDAPQFADVPRTQAAIRRGIAEGLHTGCQLFASIAGRPVADLALGDGREAAIGQPAVAMTPATIALWLSSTKPVVAAVIMQLVEAGRLELDRPVADWIPAFAVGAKESITPRHLLTHTGGFRFVEIGWPESAGTKSLPASAAPRSNATGLSARRPAIIRRAVGTSWASWSALPPASRCPALVRQTIFEPLGLNDCWIGMPLDRYRSYGLRITKLIDTERPQHTPFRYANEQGATDCIPGGNGVGPLRELARFYEMLLGDGQRGRAYAFFRPNRFSR